MAGTGRAIVFDRRTGDRAEVYGTSRNQILENAANWAHKGSPLGAPGGGKALAGGGFSLGGGSNADFFNQSALQSQAIQQQRNAGNFGGTTNQQGRPQTAFNTVPTATPDIRYPLGAPGSTQNPLLPSVPGVIGTGTGANGIRGQVEAGISQSLTSPGIDEKTIQGMVNKGNDQLTESQKSAKLAAREAAEASGFGESGAMLSNMQQIDDSYATKKAGNERDIRMDAANRNVGAKTAALGLGMNYVEDATRQAMQQQAQAAAAAALPPGAPQTPFEAEFGGGSGWISGSRRPMNNTGGDMYASTKVKYPLGAVA